LRGNFATGEEEGGRERAGEERDEICECCNEVDVYHPKICLAAKERRESVASTQIRLRKGEGVKAEGWKIERGWYTEGLSVRIIFTEKEEKEEEEEEEEKVEEEEEETLPLFDVAGETKNGG